MTEWIRATEIAPLQQRKKLKVTIAGVDVALFYVDGSVYALRDICIHEQRSLSRGLVFKGKIVCPGHQWAFDLKTGWVDQWAKCQPVFPVKVEDGVVYVAPEPRVRDVEPAPHERFCQSGSTA
jgi:nitrite reductase (NADH) small subunit